MSADNMILIQSFEDAIRVADVLFEDSPPPNAPAEVIQACNCLRFKQSPKCHTNKDVNEAVERLLEENTGVCEYGIRYVPEGGPWIEPDEAVRILEDYYDMR